jgi:hypothetical protein
MLNPQLANRIWMHGLTHTEYSVRAFEHPKAIGYPENIKAEPRVCFLSEDGEWYPSNEFPRISDFSEAIRRGELQLKFVPKSEDLEGMKFLFSKASSLLRELKEIKRGLSKEEKGKAAVLEMFENICMDYFARIDEKRMNDMEAQQPAPGEAACEVEADDHVEETAQG